MKNAGLSDRLGGMELPSLRTVRGSVWRASRGAASCRAVLHLKSAPRRPRSIGAEILINPSHLLIRLVCVPEPPAEPPRSALVDPGTRRPSTSALDGRRRRPLELKTANGVPETIVRPTPLEPKKPSRTCGSHWPTSNPFAAPSRRIQKLGPSRQRTGRWRRPVRPRERVVIFRSSTTSAPIAPGSDPGVLSPPFSC
jgi:hypothetical protein